jgi:hypothetical protein
LFPYLPFDKRLVYKDNKICDFFAARNAKKFAEINFCRIFAFAFEKTQNRPNGAVVQFG